MKTHMLHLILAVLVAASIACEKKPEADTHKMAGGLEEHKPESVPPPSMTAAPTPVSMEITSPTLSTEELMTANVVNFLTRDFLKNDLQFLTERDRKFQMEMVDLNDDGKDEYFVRFMGPYFSGSGGGTILLLDRYAEVITKFTVTRPPIYVTGDKSNGWRTLRLSNGGVLRELAFDGKSYPSNPSIAPESAGAVEGARILFDDANAPAKTHAF
jgi:hypothetical protein